MSRSPRSRALHWIVHRLASSGVSLPETDDWKEYCWAVTAFLVTGGIAAMSRPFFRRHGIGPPLPHNDSVILEYVGWFLAQGNTLYTDIWEIKPPVAFLPPYVFAHLTGGNMYAHHLLGIATTSAALIATAALTTRIVHTVTDSPEAGLAAGMTFFALPNLFYLPWFGYKAKIVVIAAGLAGLDQVLHDRYLTSGFLSGLAVGVWQLGVLFPVLTVAYTAVEGSLSAVRRYLGGILGAVLVVAATLVLYADFGGFIAEVVLGPLVLQTETAPFRSRFYFGLFPTGLGPWLTLAGLAGGGTALLAGDRREAQFVALSGVGVVGLLLIDFDGVWDMVLPLVFTAIGVGFLVGYLPRRAAIVIAVLIGLVAVPAFAPHEPVRQPPVELEPSDGLPPALDPEREHVYWTQQPIDSCRFFGAGTQRSLLQHYPNADTLAEAPCGNPDRYWGVLKNRISG